MTREQIAEIIENSNADERVNAWNYICNETCDYDGEIYTNDNDTYELLFASMDDALRAASYGNYTYTDEYCCLNAYGNLDTFSYFYEGNCPLDTDFMVDYFEEHQYELEDWFDFDPDEYEDDDDDDDDNM